MNRRMSRCLALAALSVVTRAPAASNDVDADVLSQIAELKMELAAVRARSQDAWVTQQRTEAIRDVVMDVLADADRRTSLQAANATSGYADGFFIGSPDGNFRLQINGQLQNRFAANWLSSKDMDNSAVGALDLWSVGIAKAAYGFEVRRAKLEFSGHVTDPSWQYAMTLAYQQFFGSNASPASGQYGSGGGVSQGDDYAGGVGLENAFVRKDLGSGFSVQVGQFKSPFLREWLVSSKHQLAAERSLVNTLFSTGWTQGIQLGWNNDSLRVMASYNDGGNNANLGSVSGTQTQPGFLQDGVGWAQWAFTGRGEFMAFGNWAQFDQLTSMRGQANGLLLGAAINWQRGAEESDLTAASADGPATYLTWTLDATWHLGGANVYGAWVMNTAYSNPSGLPSVNTYGVVVQAGYFIADAIELFVRWEWMSTANNGQNPSSVDIEENQLNPGAFVNNIGTLGGNWYISKNVKWTTDIGMSWNPVTFQQGLYGQDIAGADYRTEGADGGGQIVFRSQLQLLF